MFLQLELCPLQYRSGSTLVGWNNIFLKLPQSLRVLFHWGYQNNCFNKNVTQGKGCQIFSCLAPSLLHILDILYIQYPISCKHPSSTVRLEWDCTVINVINMSLKVMQENILSSKFGCYTDNTLNLTANVQSSFPLSAREHRTCLHEQAHVKLYLQYIKFINRFVRVISFHLLP